MVGEHCTHDVVLALRSETLAEAAQRMRDQHVGDLIIVDTLENRRPVGILTDRDIVVGPLAQAASHLAEVTVGDVMTTPPVMACETDTLDSALTTMAHHGIRRLPIVDGAGAISGVLALDDVVSHITGELGKLISLLAHEQEREEERRR